MTSSEMLENSLQRHKAHCTHYFHRLSTAPRDGFFFLKFSPRWKHRLRFWLTCMSAATLPGVWHEAHWPKISSYWSRPFPIFRSHTPTLPPPLPILIIYLIVPESSAYQLGSELPRGPVSLEAIGSQALWGWSSSGALYTHIILRPKPNIVVHVLYTLILFFHWANSMKWQLMWVPVVNRIWEKHY